MIHHGDCLDVLRGLETGSVDAVVTDPPYGLGTREPSIEEIVAYLGGGTLNTGGDFMGKKWTVPPVAVWRECRRVLKPGGYLLAFGGTRTWDLISMGLRAAGMQNRDSIQYLAWCYGSGFPKAKSCLKPAWEPVLLFRAPGPMRELGIDECRVGNSKRVPGSLSNVSLRGYGEAERSGQNPGDSGHDPNVGRWPPNLVMTHLRYACYTLRADVPREVANVIFAYYGHQQALPELRQGDLGDAVRSEPAEGTARVAVGVRSSARRECRLEVPLELIPDGWLGYFEFSHITGCQREGVKRVKAAAGIRGASTSIYGGGKGFTAATGEEVGYADADGMEEVEAWRCEPGCPVAEMDRQSRVLRARGNISPTKWKNSSGVTGWGVGKDGPIDLGDEGTASRFFPRFALDEDDWAFLYAAKTSRSERNEGCYGLPERIADPYAEHRGRRMPEGSDRFDGKPAARGHNHHPTVKPLALMRWLVRLACPPGGLVLDPYAGSGTTGVAALKEGRRFVGVEREAEYVEIAQARMDAAQRGADFPHEDDVGGCILTPRTR